MVNHFLSIRDLTSQQLLELVDRSVAFANGSAGSVRSLRGKAVGLYFMKTSTRTRTSFAVACSKLGASTTAFGPSDLQVNTGETIQDTARALSCYLDGLVIRSCSPRSVVAQWIAQTDMAVINAMSEDEHPSQAIADLAALKDWFGDLRGLNVLYVGDGNNTAAALALAVGRCAGMTLTLVTPDGYGISSSLLAEVEDSARQAGSVVRQFHDMASAPSSVDVVYTTRWQTTGTGKRDPDWRSRFAPFRVSAALMDRVSTQARTIFMHDLPAVRGEDVDAEVLDGPRSIAFRQARFKMFSAMAILEWSMSHRGTGSRPDDRRPLRAQAV